MLAETLSNFELGTALCIAGTSTLAKARSKFGLCSVDAENIITPTQSYNLPTSTSFTVEELYSAALMTRNHVHLNLIWRLFIYW